MNVQYSLEEQETTINVFPSVVSKKAEVYTCIPQMMKRLRKLAEDYPSEVAMNEHGGYIDATVPSAWIKIAPKRKSTMTEEQRQAAAERIRAINNAKKEASS
jgi:acetoin utilization deacetylase AcuC-like enzyme